MNAWLYIVSGMEDVKDLKHPGRELEEGVMQLEASDRRKAFRGIYNKVFFRSSMSPETASERLYIRIKPRLGLALAEKE